MKQELAPWKICAIFLVFFISIWVTNKIIGFYTDYKDQQKTIQGIITQQTKLAVDARNQIDTNERELESVKSQIQNTSISDDTSLVSEWSSHIVHMACTNDNENYSVGSGTLTNMNLSDGYTGPTVVTNAHVVTYVSDGTTYLYSYCFFKVTGNSTLYSVDPKTFQYSKSNDVEWIPVQSTLYPNSSLSTPNINVCKTSGQIGEPLVILGYPQDGGKGGYITATDGIISSFDDQFYVTDAKVDHGNSGGAAILKNEDCYAGIPSWVDPGSLESYARILDYSYVFGN